MTNGGMMMLVVAYMESVIVSTHCQILLSKLLCYQAEDVREPSNHQIH